MFDEVWHTFGDLHYTAELGSVAAGRVVLRDSQSQPITPPEHIVIGDVEETVDESIVGGELRQELLQRRKVEFEASDPKIYDSVEIDGDTRRWGIERFASQSTVGNLVTFHLVRRVPMRFDRVGRYGT